MCVWPTTADARLAPPARVALHRASRRWRQPDGERPQCDDDDAAQLQPVRRTLPPAIELEAPHVGSPREAVQVSRMQGAVRHAGGVRGALEEGASGRNHEEAEASCSPGALEVCDPLVFELIVETHRVFVLHHALNLSKTLTNHLNLLCLVRFRF